MAKEGETGAVREHLSTPGTPKATHSMILGELSLFGAWDFGEISNVVGSLIPT